MTDRDEHPLAQRAREYAAVSRAWCDAELPRGYARHAAWLLEHASAGGHSRGYVLYELDVLAREGELLTDEEFDQRLAHDLPIPYDPRIR